VEALAGVILEGAFAFATRWIEQSLLDANSHGEAASFSD
jgi:hypothetical protein